MFAAPSHMITPATGMIQKLSALIRGNAMSFAPMSGGTIRFPDPARVGVETREIIVGPCIVNNSEYVVASTMVGPGEASSVRISRGRAPPMREDKKQGARERIPVCG